MRKINRILSFVLCLLLSLSCFSFLAFADDTTTSPSMEEAKAVWFSHLESGTRVADKNSDLNTGAGSSVKVMSGLLFCELYADRLGLEIEITDALWQTASPYFVGHRLGLVRGDFVSLIDLLYAAICGSYNDAIYLLAVYTDGSVDAFVERMNRRAEELSMKNTHFEDPTGVAGGSRTTASDLALLAEYAYQNAFYMELCNAVSYRFSSVKLTKDFYNNNALVCQYKETKYYQKYSLGMSAGSSSSDGNCVITIAKHNNETYICVILGGKETDTDLYGYHIANRLINWVYKTYAYLEVVSPDSIICTIPVTVSDMTTEVSVVTDETLTAYLPRTAKLGEDIVYSVRLNATSLEAPFSERTFVGYLAVIYEDRILGTVSLYTDAGAQRSSLIGSLKGIQALFENRAVLAGLIFFVLVTTAWILTEYLLLRKRRHRWDKYFSEKSEIPKALTKPTPPDPNRLRNRHNDIKK